MDRAFAKNWQPRPGQIIVAAAKLERRVSERAQERIGQARVELISSQHAYQTMRAGIQTQVTALMAAAARTKGQPDRFFRLPQNDLNWRWAMGIPSMAQVEMVEAKILPEIATIT